LVSLIKKYVSYSICTVLGIGYFPLAPGTFASILAALIFYLIQPHTSTLIFTITIAFCCGILFSKEVEKNDGKDPGHIVIDELAGQWLTFLLLPKMTFLIILAGFFLFRLFDIMKPFGINRIQNMKNGWGVMMDDILAGLYSNIIIHILILTGLIL
jgi:phosphatidylglycerophosphatase A